MLLVVVLSAFGFFYLLNLREEYRRENCRGKIECIYAAIMMYSADYGGQFPASIQVLVDHNYLGMYLFTCPSVRRQRYSFETAYNQIDYFYIYWPMGYRTPRDYPILLDSSINNHSGNGLNYATVGGEVKWSHCGRDIDEFIRVHPQFNRTLPDIHRTQGASLQK